jgi:hypothetical protein
MEKSGDTRSKKRYLIVATSPCRPAIALAVTPRRTIFAPHHCDAYSVAIEAQSLRNDATYDCAIGDGYERPTRRNKIEAILMDRRATPLPNRAFIGDRVSIITLDRAVSTIEQWPAWQPPAGMPLVFSARRLGFKPVSGVYGPHLMRR